MTVRWGMIGAGDIVRKRVAAALRDTSGSELVAISRRDASQSEAAARETGARSWFTDWFELVKGDEIDAVYVATPVYLHAEQTIAAANAGKHVLCEKPMAMTVGQCDSMIAACRANEVKLGVAYYRRFYPVVERAKQIVDSGEIGRVALGQINAFEYFDPDAGDPRRWLLDPEKSGGGPMMDFGCHRIEVLMNLFGQITEISSLTSNMVFGRAVEDAAAATFGFENGAVGTVTVSHAAMEPRDTLDIFGTAGSIHIPSLNAGEMTVNTSAGIRPESHPPHDNYHQPLVEDFVAALTGGREPQVSGETGREVSRVLAEIYRAGKGGLAVAER